MLKLQFKDHRKAAIWLVDSRYSIGRDKANDIILEDEGVSGFHAELHVEDDDRIFLTDAGSVGGTFVNGKQIRARTQLRANDVIRIQDVELELLDPKEQLQQGGDAAATAISPALQGLEPAGKQDSEGEEGWQLKARTGSLTGKSYPLPTEKRAVIGRSKNCDIVLPSNHVSRQHAELYFHDGKLWVKDLGSSNGTFVNRKKITQQALRGGDELRFDTLVFEVQGPGEADVEEDEGEATQFRQAVDVESKPAASQPAQPRDTAAPAAKQQDTVAAAPSMPDGDDEKGGGGLWLAMVLVVLAVGGGVAWWLLG
jgi:pSer/pThr/pTyr-binding forkhead associated (FHA) protein